MITNASYTASYAMTQYLYTFFVDIMIFAKENIIYFKILRQNTLLYKTVIKGILLWTIISCITRSTAVRQRETDFLYWQLDS